MSFRPSLCRPHICKRERLRACSARMCGAPHVHGGGADARRRADDSQARAPAPCRRWFASGGGREDEQRGIFSERLMVSSCMRFGRLSTACLGEVCAGFCLASDSDCVVKLAAELVVNALGAPHMCKHLACGWHANRSCVGRSGQNPSYLASFPFGARALLWVPAFDG